MRILLQQIICAPVVWVACGGLAPAEAASIPPEVDGAMQRYVELADALLPALTVIKDQKTAEENAAGLQDMLSRVYDVRRDLKNIESLDPEVTKAVRAKYETKMRTGWGKVYEHIIRLQRAKCYGSVACLKQFQTLCLFLEK